MTSSRDIRHRVRQAMQAAGQRLQTRVADDVRHYHETGQMPANELARAMIEMLDAFGKEVHALHVIDGTPDDQVEAAQAAADARGRAALENLNRVRRRYGLEQV
jgi:Asp-tRNA(Asn)/Glu-tRNA(Gln) amidotransferase A subunit family amidase